MAKVTWLGEDAENYAGPSFTRCFEMKFPKGEPVDVTDKSIIERARRNRFFKVEGVPGRPPKAVEQANEQNAG